MNEQQFEKYADIFGSKVFEDHLLQSILTLIQDGVCFLSKDLDILYANPAMTLWYALKDNSIGKKCYEVYHNSTEPCKNCPALRTIETGKPEVEEKNDVINQTRQGWLRVMCMPITDHKQETVMIIEYVRDVTDERKSLLTLELMKNQIEGLSKIISQKEKEYYEEKQKFIENINLSIDVVLRYLSRVLDKDSYETVKNQLNITNNGMDSRNTALEKLSEQELIIANYIANGYMSKEIAEKINLSKKTVDYHRTNIRKKLNLSPDDNLRDAILAYFSEAGISQINTLYES